MNRNVRRITLAPAYLLHHRPYRDTSRILEVFARDHGRLTVFARGVRGPKARFGPLLQPFRLLLLSWTGRGEAVQLTAAESADLDPPMPPDSLMGSFYLSELLLKLTTRHDPQPALFDDYDTTVAALRRGAPLEPSLRLFEKRLLDAVGYGIELTSAAGTGQPVRAQEFYHYRPEQGLVATSADSPGAIAGSSLLALANERLSARGELDDARRLLQTALGACLEGRELLTRSVARAVRRRRETSGVD